MKFPTLALVALAIIAVLLFAKNGLPPSGEAVDQAAAVAPLPLRLTHLMWPSRNA